jgi:hypothetical protein
MLPACTQAGGIPQLRQLCDEIGIDVQSPVKMPANLLHNSSEANNMFYLTAASWRGIEWTTKCLSRRTWMYAGQNERQHLR